MPSSKGKPTKREWILSSRVFNPILTHPLYCISTAELREKIKNQIQSESPGGWAAWKAAKLAKQYEEAGGGYEDTGDNDNKPKKGTPEPKEGVKKDAGGAAQTQKREKRQREGEDVNQTDKNEGEEGGAKDKDKATKQSKTKTNGDVKQQKQNGAGKDDAEKTTKKAGSGANGKAKKEQKPAAKGSRTQPSRASKK